MNSPNSSFLIRQNISAVNTVIYIKYYDKVCNFNSQIITPNNHYCMNLGDVRLHILQTNLSDGALNKVITPSGYSCQQAYWSIAISVDETHAFFSAQKNGLSVGSICKWEVGTLNNINCLDLGTLYVPLFIKRIVSNKVFIEANEPVLDKDLYFVYLDLDTNDLIWNK